MAQQFGDTGSQRAWLRGVSQTTYVLIEMARLASDLPRRGVFPPVAGTDVTTGDMALSRMGEQLETSVARLARSADALLEQLVLEIGSSLETVISAVERYDFRSGSWTAFLRKRLQWMVLHERVRSSRR